MKPEKTIFLVLIVLFMICLDTAYNSQAEEGKFMASQNRPPLKRDNNPFHLSLGSYIGYGQLMGHLQSGEDSYTGTGSTNSPDMRDDLGFSEIKRGNFFAELGWNRHSLQSSSHLLKIKGKNTLGKTLIFDGITYPAGTQIKSDLKSNWYELGYRYRFPLDPNKIFLTLQGHEEALSESAFSIIPTVTIAYWNFYLQLKDGGTSNEKKYSHVTPRFGAILEWNPLPGFSVTAEAIRSLPCCNNLSIHTFELATNYDLIRRDIFKLGLNIRIGYEKLRYEDAKTLPDQIKIDLGPMIMGGLKLKF